MNMKKFLVLILALAIGFTIVSCGGSNQAPTAPASGGSAPRGQGEIYVTIGSLFQLEFFDALKSGVYNASEQIGATWYFAGPQDFVPDQIVQAIDQAVANRVTGIILHGQTPETAAAVDNAIAAGVPVIVVNTDIPSKRLSFLGCSPYQAGYDMGAQMADLIRGKTGTVIITTAFSIAQPSALENARGARDALTGIQGVRIVDIDGVPDANATATNIGAALQAYPDVIGIIGQQAFSAVGICTAIREAGMTGRIPVIGRDRDVATLELIEKGELVSSYAQNSFVEGYIATMWLHDYVNGNLKVINDYLGTGTNPLPKNVDSGSIVININNYKQFLEPYRYTVTARN
jgi:ribose transport system substrate-binding protein